MAERQDGSGMQATATFTQKVDRAFEQAYEALLAGIYQEARAFGGIQSREVIKSETGSYLDYRLILHFESAAALRRWERSSERRKWMTRLTALAVHTSPWQVLTGLEAWFTLPGQGALVPPPRHKMAVVTWLALFPLIMVIAILLEALFGELPILLHAFIASALAVPLMTYVIMPRMTRLFRSWLFGPGGHLDGS
ncbi:MAG: hypothetical protein AAF495_22655 [Pseudomonadota bacterium]